MTIDPQVIRAERHSTIGTLIARDAEVLLERWQYRAVEEQPNARRVHQQVLLDKLACFLRALGRSLAESDDAEIPIHYQPALEHGEQRWETGWSLPEVVRDYQILRLVILQHLEDNLQRPLRYREIMAINLGLDEAIAASVGIYVSSREEYIRQVERERADKEKQADEVVTRTLKETDQRKNEFLAMLGHELRNSLAPVLNSVEVLRLLGSTEPAVEQVRDLVERQARQMVRLVDDMLDISRLARGQIELRMEPLDLAEAVKQAIETSNPLIQGLNHQLCVEMPAEQVWLEADRARLIQIIANLLNNAAKYTDPGGRITIRGERTGPEMTLRVRDTGMGIAPEMLSRVFDLFTQVDPSSQRTLGGMGVGLTLVKKLVELHGGKVSAYSAGVGQGSEFVVRLPALPEKSEEARGVGAAPETSASGRHVLIIEDNPDGRETMATLLQLLGHKVEVAEDGAEGVQMALASRPQVALVDLGLPTLDGLEVARQLRAALGDQVFLIALTGYGQAEDRRRTLEAGFDAHLVKPVDTEELSLILTRLPSAQK